ncbi:MAG: hypothetical protein RH948_02505 [Cyclobacteriaceae bacterium]|jgi:hypothetical protein
MRTESIKQRKRWKVGIMGLIALLGVFTMVSCDDDDDPVKEDVPELITKATLTFTPAGGGTPVTSSATDPDGEGVQDIEVDGPINLTAGTTYTLTVSLINELADPTDEEYNITEEVEEEGDEHMFFYAWTNDVFSDPSGNGNIDNRADDVNYEDEDDNGQPLGLTTSWTAGSASTGTFRVVLKHQPDLKTDTSDANTGESDLDVIFTINVN